MHGPGAMSLTREPDHWVGRFVAMACPCEVLIDSPTEALARVVVDCVSQCAWRIEHKFSRYRQDNIVHRINTSNGRPIHVDDETARLLDFAATLTALSEGRFDITSGILRKAWTFDGGTHVPAQADIDALLACVGWHKVLWDRQALQLQLQPGMQIDFGGTHIVPLLRGALATSGDSRRFVLHAGRRYSHILDARTGWPVEHAPRAISVAADTCTQAGTLTTLAMLSGAQAETFLKASGAKYWLQ